MSSHVAFKIYKQLLPIGGDMIMNFKVYFNPSNDCNAFVILTTPEEPFTLIDDISSYLKNNKCSGNIIIDQLLHSGNNDERFISGIFNGQTFDKASFRFEPIKKQAVERKYMCDFLRNDENLLDFSLLTKEQKALIKHGFNI